MLCLVLFILLPQMGSTPVCEKPPDIRRPVLAPIECMSYSTATQECAAACYWPKEPGRPDAGSWDNVVRAFATTREGCRKLLEELCAAKRGRPQ